MAQTGQQARKEKEWKHSVWTRTRICTDILVPVVKDCGMQSVVLPPNLVDLYRPAIYLVPFHFRAVEKYVRNPSQHRFTCVKLTYDLLRLSI